jgi:hypothetical protein
VFALTKHEVNIDFPNNGNKNISNDIVGNNAFTPVRTWEKIYPH